MRKNKAIVIVLSGLFFLGSFEIHARPRTEKQRSITLKLDTLRTRDRDSIILRTREGDSVRNPVDPYIIQMATQLKLINPDGVREGDTPIIGRSLRVSFARGSQKLGFETRTRLLSFVQGLNQSGDIRGLVVVAASDNIDGDEKTNVSMVTNRAERVMEVLREAGLSEEKIYLGNIAELAASSRFGSSEFDVVVIE